MRFFERTVEGGFNALDVCIDGAGEGTVDKAW